MDIGERRRRWSYARACWLLTAACPAMIYLCWRWEPPFLLNEQAWVADHVRASWLATGGLGFLMAVFLLLALWTTARARRP